jgi:phosphate uptake regulator
MRARRISISSLAALSMLTLGLGSLAGCEEGTFEEAGEDTDEMIEDTEDALEDAGDEIDDELDDLDDDTLADEPNGGGG